MKRTYRKNLIRTIRDSLSRFMAVFAIVALGVGFLAGLLATTPDMEFSADKMFDDSNLFDLRLVGTMGLTDDDVEAVRQIDGVQDLMPAYSTDVLVDAANGEEVVTRIQSVPLEQLEQKEPTGYLNRMTVVEGRLPVKEDECVVQVVSGESQVQVGDTVTVSDNNGDLSGTLSRTQFKVVGRVTTPQYFSMEPETATVGNGTLQMVLYTGEQNFALSVWTDLYITVADAKSYNSLSDDYTDFVDETAQRIEAIAQQRNEIRYQQVKQDAQTALADAQKEYENKKEEADQQLSQAEQQLEDGQAQIQQSEQQLSDAKEQIAQGQQQLEDSKNALPETLTQKAQELSDAKAQLVQAKAQYEQGEKELEAQEQALKEGKEQVEQAKQLVQTLEPVVQQAQQSLPQVQQQVTQLEQAAQTAQSAADAAQSAADQAQQKAQSAHDTSPLPQLQQTLQQAQQQIDDQRGDLTEEEWAQQNPEIAQPLIQARNQAKLAVQAEQTRLDTLDAAAQQMSKQADFAQQQAQAAEQAAQQAQQLLDTTTQTLDQGSQQLEQAKAQIAENEPKIQAGETQLAAAKQQLADAQQQIIEGEKKLAEGETSLNLAPDLAKLQLDLAQEKLEDSQRQVEEGQTQLDDAKNKLQEGQKEYDENKQTAQQQLADAQAQLDDAQKQIDDMQQPEWYLLTRDQNMSVNSFKSNSQKVAAVAHIFPIFFFLVAALVALTTMTRMVEEERMQIGTMKALGYRNGAIMSKYVIYAMTATIAGCVVGLAIGLTLFPSVIWNAYAGMYQLPKLYTLPNLTYSIMASVAAVACTLVATLSACWSTMAEVPAAMMLPKAPPAGKRILLERITPIWSRMKFTHKVTARNLFRYKKRFFMTVIGISGCTALLVSSFGLHDAVSDVVYKQFSDVFHFDAMLSLKQQQDVDTDAVQDVLKDSSLVKDWMQIHEEKADNINGENISANLLVPKDPDQLSRFIDLHERTSGTPVAFSQDGVVITEKLSKRAGVSVGDTITISNADKKEASFRVDGIVENYLDNYIYLSADTYQQFGDSPEFDSVLIQSADDTQEIRDQLGEKLLNVDGVSGISFSQDMKQMMDSMLQKIDVIVAVMVVSAGLLAFVVLYNLTNINITERIKEIATIKVLGFYDKEVSAYVYRESVVLSLIGTAVGLVLGIALNSFVVQSVEADTVMFGRTIKPLSFLISAGLTILFSCLVNLVMHRKLKKISMVESMKAPE